jgi:hypothetical protein
MVALFIAWSILTHKIIFLSPMFALFFLFYVNPCAVNYITSVYFGSLTIIKTPRRKFG